MAAAACASSAVNFPRMNSARMIRSGTTQERRDARDREQQRELDRALLRERARRASSPAAMPPRHFGQQHGADRDADHAAGELIEPVRVIERRERAGREEACDDGVGEQRKLHAGRADGRRPERLEEALHVRVEPGPPQRGHHVGAQRSAADEQHLQHARDQHAPRRGVAGASGRTPRCSSVATMVRLSRIGAAAAVANLPIELRMPENSVTSVISRRYGNVMRVSVDRKREARRIVAETRARAARSPQA